MKLNWKKTLGFGVVVWVVIFIFVTILIAFGLREETFIRWLITQIVVIITAVILAKKLSLTKTTTALSTGLIWIVISLILDLLITSYFTTMEFFNSWKIWVSYAIILVVPVFCLKKEKPQTTMPPTANL